MKVLKGILGKAFNATPAGVFADLYKVVKRHVRDEAQAERIARQMANELEKTELAGSIETRNKEIEGTLKQKSWRPDWMYMLRNLLYSYFGLTIAMFGFAFFIGIARGKTWPTDASALEFYGIWLGIGAMITTLTTGSFWIYGGGRTKEKIASGEPTTSIIGNLKEIISPNGARETPEKRKRGIPVVRTSDAARKRLDKAIDVNPTRVHAQRKVARQRIDVELDAEPDVYVPTPTGNAPEMPVHARPYVGDRIEVEQS